jgi:hypothetical protein
MTAEQGTEYLDASASGDPARRPDQRGRAATRVCRRTFRGKRGYGVSSVEGCRADPT